MKKILVIEDNEEVRENLEEILELSGYAVDGAEDGKVGVELAMADPPDLILCDVMMPKLDGYGVLNILSKKPETAAIPFIFLTAKADKEDLRRGMNLGADDYITKPFYKDELLQVIETRLKKNEKLQRDFNPDESGLSAFINEARAYEELKKLSADRKIRTYKPKESLFAEDDYPRYLYFVKSGQIKLYKTNDFGKELILKLLGPGDFFGYTPLIEQINYPYSAAATEETEVSLVPREDFSQLLFANRDVSARFIQLLAQNIREKEKQLLELAYNSVRKRVANALLVIGKQQDSPKIHLLREDLARIVGTAKESVIRMLAEFKEDGYISIEDGVIHIIDEEKLENMPG
ncbi:MAG: response regulator [Bacteroidetes bacterium]|nr:response regulator [Bacteroidota bacterium]